MLLDRISDGCLPYRKMHNFPGKSCNLEDSSLHREFVPLATLQYTEFQLEVYHTVMKWFVQLAH